MGMHRTWTVRVNNTEHEGRSVWDNCPFAPGLEVYLHVLDLPVVAVRIGDYDSRLLPPNPGPGLLNLPGSPRFVNGLLHHGPWPGGDWPLKVGCELNILPAWETSFDLLDYVAADMPEPTGFSNEGIDVRTLDQVELWGGVPSGAAALDFVRVFPWVRHPGGLWAQVHGLTAPASARATRYVIDTKAAERLYGQIVWAGPITQAAYLLYGRLTAPPSVMPANLPPGPLLTYPADELTVRFGAIEAPSCCQGAKQ